MNLVELTVSGFQPPSAPHVQPHLVPHLVLRGTYLPSTVRCTSGDRFRPPKYLDNFGEYPDVFAEIEGTRAFKCYVDVRVNSYIAGDGPANLTILRMWFPYMEEWYSGAGATVEEAVEEGRQFWETGVEGRSFEGLDDILPGNEEILLLGPPLDLSSEAWQWWGSLGVERREDGVIVATNPAKPLWEQYRPDDYETYRSELEMDLPEFVQVVGKWHEARANEYGGRIGADPSLPMLIADAHRLREFFIEVGAYHHPDGPPVKPPPVATP